MNEASKKLPLPDLIAFDLDFTLLRDDHTLSERTAAALRELNARGCIPLISTGRNYQGVLPFIRQLGYESPVISSNGAMICNGLDGTVLHEWPLPDDITSGMLKEARRLGIHFQGFNNRDLFYERQGEESDFYEGITGLKGKVVQFDTWKSFHFIKALMIGPPGRSSGKWPELHEARQLFDTLFGKRLYAVFSRPCYLDLMNGEASKGIALQTLCDDLSIDPVRVAAFGDAPNDADMLNVAGISVAMKNAPREIRNQADWITNCTNNDDGVAEFIESRFF